MGKGIYQLGKFFNEGAKIDARLGDARCQISDSRLQVQDSRYQTLKTKNYQIEGDALLKINKILYKKSKQ